MNGKLTQAEISKTVDFCFHAFQPTAPKEREAVLRKLEGMGLNDSGSAHAKTEQDVEELQALLSPDELRVLNTIRARQMVRSEDTLNIESFSSDVIDGMAAHLQRGDLGLVKATAAPAKLPEVPEVDALALLIGEETMGEQAKGKGEGEEVKPAPVSIAAH